MALHSEERFQYNLIGTSAGDLPMRLSKARKACLTAMMRDTIFEAASSVLDATRGGRADDGPGGIDGRVGDRKPVQLL